jgi:hypothetical protein
MKSMRSSLHSMRQACMCYVPREDIVCVSMCAAGAAPHSCPTGCSPCAQACTACGKRAGFMLCPRYDASTDHADEACRQPDAAVACCSNSHSNIATMALYQMHNVLHESIQGSAHLLALR